MSTYKIDGFNFYEAVRAGAAQLMANKNELNRINIFPVADGDTGSNMSATLKAIVEHMEKRESLSQVADLAAEGALIGARGNSGMILAQFFYAFASETGNEVSMELDRFIQSVKNASNRLYDVVLNPVEGTILTLIVQWVQALERRSTNYEDIKAYAELVLKDTEEALTRTSEQMPLLKSKGVVDSGAKGFYHFLEGVNNFITKGQVGLHLSELENQPMINHTHNHFNDAQTLTYRYCCEALVHGNVINASILKNHMSYFGDSLVLAGGANKYRVHLHTNDPESMFASLSNYGRLSQMKVDDMALQSSILKGTLGKVAIVTDSIADLPEDFTLRNQVSVISLTLEIDGVDYLDRVTMSTHRFYSLNKNIKSQPKSSLPSIKQVETLLNFLTSHFESVLVLSVSDKLSGTYEMIASVARLIDPSQEKILVFNTLKNSGAQGLMVLYASDLAKKGHSIQKIVEALNEKVSKTAIFVAVNTTKYLARSGRVSLQFSKIANWINIKPIMTLNLEGYGTAYGAALSTASTIRKIKKDIQKTLKHETIDTYNIVHGANPQGATYLADEMTKLIGFPPAYIAEISPIVGSVAGEGAIAVSYMLK